MAVNQVLTIKGSEVKVAQLCLTLCDPMDHTVFLSSLVSQLVKNLPAMWETWV